MSPPNRTVPLPHSAALRPVLIEARMQAKAIDREREVGTEHLLAGLMAESSSAAERLLAAGLELEGLRSHLAEQLSAHRHPCSARRDSPARPGRAGGAVDLGRILDASANRAREGLRVVEDYVRFVLDDPGLTRRFKEVRHRLAEAERGLRSRPAASARATPARTSARTS